MPHLTPTMLDQMRHGHVQPRQWIRVGLGTSGVACGAAAVFQMLRDEVARRGLDVAVQRTGTLGLCSLEPVIEVCVDGVPPTFYGRVDVQAAQWIVDAHVISKRVVEAHRFAELDAARQQMRIVLRNAGIIDAQSIGDYIARDGYQGLRRCVTSMTPQQVIDEIEASGLRGRGGAGYPTGLKWRYTAAAPGNEKWVICNGDEGDPGAFMNRVEMEDDPHAVVEGMAIAAYAQGARQGIFFIRADYPAAITSVRRAILQARRMGLLGRNILGSGFDFVAEIRLGAGAFVCGEETALIASIEGGRATPRPRPPYPSQCGLFGCPTTINNVETLANVPTILRRGAAWFAAIGTSQSKGTKVFAVTGNIARPGLVEVPMGTTLRQIIAMCGGGRDGQPIKAVQTGGPSGGMMPASLLDTPVSYEDLAAVGSIMGSGGLIVLRENDSIVEMARYYMGFCAAESCGKCAACRIGGKQALTLLEKITGGRGTIGDVALLARVCRAMKAASLCGLGQNAPNPVLSSLRHFRPEYDQLLATAAGDGT